MDGIASPHVRVMGVRAVPNGDERDKDVANAIRYAVDEGAHIINMSFGKSFSPDKELVDAAVRYADENGALLIHAAGNDGANLAEEENFPNRSYLGGGTAANWITGAVRVRAGGQPVLLQDSQSRTVPNAVPLSIVATQVRVRGA